jgi:hypothetical protein
MPFDPREHFKSSSTLSFARALFHAGEARELFDKGFSFPGAVSAYYSLFHLGQVLVLAAWAHDDPQVAIRRKLEDRKQDWLHRQGASTGGAEVPDPAELIRHEDVPPFLDSELPSIGLSLGKRGVKAGLRDMREFVSYAPRMKQKGVRTILWTGCQYYSEEFRVRLMQHLAQIDTHFVESIRWLGRKDYSDIRGTILSGPFVLYEFKALCEYHPHSVARRAWSIYRHVCEQEGVDSCVYNPLPGLWVADEQKERRIYEKTIASLGN